MIPTLEIKGIEIECVPELQNLDAIINVNLSRKRQTNILSNKMSKYSCLLNKLKNGLSLYVMKTYLSFVGSALDYRQLTWK